MASNKLYSMAAIKQSTSDSQIADILNAKDTMFDVIGVLQHHDAITGTGKQHVANNYAEKVSAGMDINNKQYAKMIAEHAEAAGIHHGMWH